MIFFLLFAPRGACGLHSLPSTNSVQSDHLSLAQCKTHCLILFSTFLHQVAIGLPFFLFPWRAHLKATLVILLRDILKTCPSHQRRHFLLLSELAWNVFRRVSPNLRCSWARKSDRSYVGIYFEIPRSYRNPFQKLAGTSIRTTAQIGALISAPQVLQFAIPCRSFLESELECTTRQTDYRRSQGHLGIPLDKKKFPTLCFLVIFGRLFSL